MEYSQLKQSVQDVTNGVDDAYQSLMKHEQDALRVAERISEDDRRRAVHASSLWNTPLSTVFQEYVKFLRQVYELYVEGDQKALVERVATPDGLIGGGITVLIILLLVALLRT